MKEIRASGVFTRSELWLQIIASVLNHELAIPATGETSSLGAACWALLGSGTVEHFEDLHALVPLEKTYQPNPKESLLYDSIYRIYTDLYARLGDSFEQLSAGLASREETP